MLSYVYFGTNDLAKAIAFYNAALAPLGMERCITGDPEWDRISAGWGTYEEGAAREPEGTDIDLTLTLQDMSELRETDKISRQTTHSNNGGA